MDNLKDITKGKAIATGHGAYINGYAASSIECDQVDGARVMVAYVLDGFDAGQGIANAQLYCEAHNVAQATGKSPQTLADERGELLAEVERLRKALKGIEWSSGSRGGAETMRIMMDTIKRQCQDALSKHKK